MQEKLAITIILISLALFALIFVLYRIVNENSERYNKIVLSQRQQEYASRTIPYSAVTSLTETAPIWQPVKRYTI